ncbi:hypothetical protein A2V95_03200 [Candidatus Kuenenbacteria bacterium RBG_16_41_7]|uniref:UPF0235 protein A2V95_03200 n=1 Tax=Candidatus Kuenenbacteria bacterium RBG_16_41_7 TaxID=1798560 RepID=A0A1F6GD19_9BACT|nr:MAG: hypothetical protein A2V95_03200 [Candidatus Kuenenbacteria bacterium RBG_16_41_7]
MIIKAKVTPKAKVNKVTQLDDTHFEIHTTAAPDKGKANDAMIKLLAKHLGLSPSSFNIIKGATSRHKLVRIK